MSDLDELEEIERQTTIRVNEPEHKRKLSVLGVPLTMRESPRPPSHQQPRPESSARPRPSPALAVERQPASIRTMPELVATPDEVIAVIRRHQDFVEVFRTMKERLGLTNNFIDDVGGLALGHVDKILGPSETKNWGPTTFDLLCEMFAIEFRVHVDIEAAKRMRAVWEGRERPLYPDAKTKRISKKL